MSESGVLQLKVSGFALIWAILVLSVVLFPLCFILFFLLNSEGIVYVRDVPQLPTLLSQAGIGLRWGYSRFCFTSLLS